MKLREIERLRGVAILMVMCIHSPAICKLLPVQFTEMWSGVDLFFVISGYVVSLSFARLLPPLDDVTTFAGAFEASSGPLRTFFMRRFFRIMPLALTVMVVNRLLAAMYPPYFGHPDDLFEEAVAFFGGAYNYTSPFKGHAILEFYWSLSVEEHFYLILPFLFILCRTKSSRFGAAVFVGLVSILARGLLPLPHGASIGYLRFASHLRFDSLMAGVGLALLSPKIAAPPLMPRGLMRFFILPVAIGLICALPYSVPRPVMDGMGFIPLWALSALLVRFAALDQGYVLQAPGLSRAFEYIGSRSYGLYLVHRLMFRLDDSLDKLSPAYNALIPTNVPHPWMKIFVGVSMSLVAAEILYRTVERPLNRLGHQLSNPERAPYVLPTAGKVLAIAGGVVATILVFHHPLLAALGSRDVARGRNVTMSARDGGHQPGPDALVNGSLETGSSPCTLKAKSPWMVIDLGTETEIGAIRVYNRSDGWEQEQIPLVVGTSDDGKEFHDLFKRTAMFTQDLPWRIALHNTRARYVRVMGQHKDETPLCLSEVEVFKSSVMAQIP